MPRLKSANNAETTLSAAIGTTDVSFTVTDASAFPDAPFRITVDGEIMEVGAIDRVANTFSGITRGIEGTTAASHSAGATIQNRLTAGTYNELASQSTVDDHINNTGNPHAVTPAQIGAVSTSGSSIMTGDLQIENDNPGIYLTAPGAVQPTVLRWNRNINANNGLELSTSGSPNVVFKADGSTTLLDTLTFNTVLSDVNKLIDYQQGYGLFSDNVGFGSANSRLWIDAPHGGEINIAPRTAADILSIFKVRANTHYFEGNGSLFELRGNDHLYLGFYPKYRAGDTARYGFMGFGSATNNDFTIQNGMGDILIAPDGGASFIFSSVTNGMISFSTYSGLKFASGMLLARNTADSAYVDMYAKSFVTSSDIGFKDDLNEFSERALDKLTRTKVYNYKFKDDIETMGRQDAPRRLGLVAQEAPAEVKTTTDDGEEMIDLYAMTTLMWKSIQELNDKINSLGGGTANENRTNGPTA